MKISVIIPVYGAEKTIEKCVNSIIANNYDDMEIILVEDCSKDNSWIKCQELAIKYDKVICIRNEVNRGVSYTRNQGLTRATGQYIVFIDSDDWIDENYFAEFSKVIDRKTNTLAVCGYINHDEKQNGTVDVCAWKDFQDVRECSIKEIILSLYDKNLLQQLWNKVFISDIIRKHNIIFDENISIGEDTRFVLEYLQKGEISSISLVNKALYHYIRGQEGSLMYRVGYESVDEPIKNKRMLYQLLDMSRDEMEAKLAEDRKKQIELYAYLIFHNMGMRRKEKKKLIYNLDEQKGRELYYHNKILYYKERIALVINKLKSK